MFLVQTAFQETVIDGAVGAQEYIPIVSDVYVNPHAKLTSHSSSDTTGTNMADTGTMEVPVIIERHAVFQSKVDKSSPLEIRSLEGSPPQRRSPSLKSRSLSPAEQVTHTFASNTLVDGNIADGVDAIFSRDMYIEKGAIPKIKMNNNNYQVSSSSNNCESDSDSTQYDTPSSPRSVVQLAAKKLEDVIQRHGCRENGTLPMIVNVSDDGHQVPPRWADKACYEIRYIDEDNEVDTMDQSREHRETIVCSVQNGGLSAREIMSSTLMLADLDTNSARTSTSGTDVTVKGGKRLVLAPPPPAEKLSKVGKSGKGRKSGRHQGASRDFLCNNQYASDTGSSQSTSPKTSIPSSPILGGDRHRRSSLEIKRVGPKHEGSKHGGIETAQSASLPTSPVHRIIKPNPKKAHSKQDVSVNKSKMSPLSKRRLKSCKAVDSSDEEITMSGDEVLMTCANYKNLETFQKAQLTKKVCH